MGNRDVFLRHDFCVCSIRRLDSKTFARTESCVFVKISNVTKGGSTGSADTAEGVKKQICGSHSRGPRTAGLGLFFESFL